MRTKPLPSLALLKEATHDLHRQLDQATCMTRLLSPRLDLGDYACLLHRLHGIYAELEPKILLAENLFGPVAAWQPKTGWLEADLRALQCPTHDADGMPHTEAGWHIRSQAGLAGCLYVLEGSTLGGQVILGKVQASLGVKIAASTRFFSAYGPATYPAWAQVRACIDRCLQKEEDIQRACQAARQVFEFFIANLETDDIEKRPTFAIS